MNKRVATSLFLVLALLALPCSLLAAQPQAPLADRLPKGAVAYFGWAGKTQAFDNSMLGQLVAEPGFLKTVSSIVTGAKAQMRHEEQQELLEHGLAMADILWRHQIAVSLLDLVPADGSEIPNFSAALLVDLGKDKAEFDKHLTAILRFVPETAFGAETVGDSQFRVINDSPQHVSFGYVGNMFMMAVGKGTAQQIAALKPADSLAADKDFITAMAAVGGADVVAASYIDVKGGLPKIKAAIKAAHASDPDTDKNMQMVDKVIDALGLAQMTAVASTTRVVDKGMYTKVKLFTPAPHKGVLSLMSDSTLTDADMAALPADSDFAVAFKLSPTKTYAELREVVGKIDPNALAEMDQEIAKMEKSVGISLQTDLLECLGDTFTLSDAASQGGLLTGAVLTVEVKDDARLQETIAKIEGWAKKQIGQTSQPATMEADYDQSTPYYMRRQPPRIETDKTDKAEIHYVTLGRHSPIAPAWAVYKGKLYVALWPQVIETTIDNIGVDPLTKDAAFVKVRSRLSAKVSCMSYANLTRMVRTVYGLGMFGWTMGSSEIARETGIQVKPSWLPALSKIEKYLWPQIQTVSSDNDGIIMESYGSLPGGNLLLGGPLNSPVGVAVLMPSLFKAREQAKRSSSRMNLVRIGGSMGVYVNNHNDEYPDSLDTLVKEENLHPSVLISPISGKKDYIYIKPVSTDDPTGIMAYEKPENYGNKGTVVLRVDYSVQWWDMAELQAALEKTKQKNATQDF